VVALFNLDEGAGRTAKSEESIHYSVGIPDLTEVAALIAGADLELGRLLVGSRLLGTDETRAPSSLPGWTRGHVLSHLARNADAQVRLLNAALRNEHVEQYRGGLSGRAEEIERGADRPAETLVDDVEQSAAKLAATWQQMTAEAWDRSAAGTIAGERPASATVWARWGELALHHVDLGIGFSPMDWSPDFVWRLLRRALPRMKERLADYRDISVAVVDDSALSWSSTRAADLEVSGPSAALVAWITGRTGPWLAAIKTTTRAGAIEQLPAVRPWG
jgi:maleylpyruvate isomerase